MNKCYHQLVLSKVHSVVNEARAIGEVNHAGLKGQLREILVRDLFRPLYPADVGVGTGEIITARNEQSAQQDIVLYDKRILPPILMESSTGLFPIESVLYAIEVKSTLTSSEMKCAHENAKKIWDMFYLPPLGNKQPPGAYQFVKVKTAVFAFNSDLSVDGKNEIERYDEIRSAEYPFIDVICVVGRGYWYWKDANWVGWRCEYPLHEVMGFLSGIHNTYRELIALRGAPLLGNYLLE